MSFNGYGNSLSVLSMKNVQLTLFTLAFPFLIHPRLVPAKPLFPKA